MIIKSLFISLSLLLAVLLGACQPAASTSVPVIPITGNEGTSELPTQPASPSVDTPTVNPLVIAPPTPTAVEALPEPATAVVEPSLTAPASENPPRLEPTASPAPSEEVNIPVSVEGVSANEISLAAASDASGTLWSADLETGSISQWSPYGEFITQGNGSSYQVVRSPVHGGKYALGLTIDTTAGSDEGYAAYMFMYAHEILDGDNYYSAWYYIPSTIQVKDWWSIWQWKSTYDGSSDNSVRVFSLGVRRGTNGIELVLNRRPTPNQSDSNNISYFQTIKKIPTDQWFFVEAYYKRAVDNTGRVIVWQDGTQIYDIQNVNTVFADNTLYWSLHNYTDYILPNPETIYIDDVRIGKGPAAAATPTSSPTSTTPPASPTPTTPTVSPTPTVTPVSPTPATPAASPTPTVTPVSPTPTTPPPSPTPTATPAINSLFNPAAQWLDGPGAYTGYQFLNADVNGDGKPDVVGVNAAQERFMVWINNGSGFDAGVRWLDGPSNYRAYIFNTGDVNGDQYADLIAVKPDSERLVVWLSKGSYSKGTGFKSSSQWYDGPGNYGAYPTFLAIDLNGDKRCDVLVLNPATEKAYVWTSKGSVSKRSPGFNPAQPWLNGSNNLTGYDYSLADATGDGRPDLVGIDPATEKAVVWPNSAGTGLGSGQTWLDGGANYSAYKFAVSDINADGRPDFVAMDLANERAVVWSNTGSQFGPAVEAYKGANNYSGYTFTAGTFSNDAKGDLLAIDAANEKFMIWTAK